jgi:hypothetical protein
MALARTLAPVSIDVFSHLAELLVSSHMAFCVGVSENRDATFSITLPEPIIAHQALQLLCEKWTLQLLLPKLESSMGKGIATEGRRGEVVASIIMLLAVGSVYDSEIHSKSQWKIADGATSSAFSLGKSSTLGSSASESAEISLSQSMTASSSSDSSSDPLSDSLSDSSSSVSPLDSLSDSSSAAASAAASASVLTAESSSESSTARRIDRSFLKMLPRATVYAFLSALLGEVNLSSLLGRPHVAKRQRTEQSTAELSSHSHDILDACLSFRQFIPAVGTPNIDDLVDAFLGHYALASKHNAKGCDFIIPCLLPEESAPRLSMQATHAQRFAARISCILVSIKNLQRDSQEYIDDVTFKLSNEFCFGSNQLVPARPYLSLYLQVGSHDTSCELVKPIFHQTRFRPDRFANQLCIASFGIHEQAPWLQSVFSRSASTSDEAEVCDLGLRPRDVARFAASRAVFSSFVVAVAVILSLVWMSSMNTASHRGAIFCIMYSSIN